MARARIRPGRIQTDVPKPRARAIPWWWSLAAVFLVALLWRLAYLGRLAASPLGGSRIADAQSYWDWASYLLAHGPLGKNPFFLAPLYPYTIAFARLGLGNDPQRVLMLQAVWGAAAAALLADAARRMTRPAVGLAVGFMVALARMATFFDGLVLAESLLFALGAGLAWSVARTRGRRVALNDALLWGLLVGLLAQGRAMYALLLLPAVALAWQTAETPRDAARVAAAVVLSFGMVCAPGAIRNTVVSHEWIPFTYNAGYNLCVGNNSAANGSFVPVTGTHDITDARVAGADGGIEGDGRRYIEETQGLRLGPNASSRWWAGRAYGWIAAHPGAATRLWLRKLSLAWSRHESPQIENVDEFRMLAGPLGVPWGGSFALLAALAMAGLFLAWTRGPQERFFAAYVSLATIGLLPFFVTDRYRHQLIPGALMLAAIGADAGWRAARARRVSAPALSGAALGLLLALWPVPHLGSGRASVSLAGDLGMRWLERGRADLAERELAGAVNMDRRGEVRWLATADDSLNRALLYYQHARSLTAMTRGAEALAAMQRAAGLAPGSDEIAGALAAAYADCGEEARAALIFARLGRPDGVIESAVARGWSLAGAGNFAGAEKVFQTVVAGSPSRFDAWGALVRLQAQGGRMPEARATLESGHAAGWSGPAYDANTALVLAVEGHGSEARSVLARVPPAAIAADPVLADVVRAVKQVLGS